MARPVLRGRTCSRHGSTDAGRISSVCWMDERVTIRHPRSCHGAGPSRVTATRARAAVQLMILGAGGGDPQPSPFVRLARSEPLRNRRRARAGVAPARGPPPSCRLQTNAAIGPFTGTAQGVPDQGEKAGGSDARLRRNPPAKAHRSSQRYMARTSKCSPVTPARKVRHMGACVGVWSGRPRLSGFASLFFAHSLLLFLVLLFSALLRRPPLEPIWDRGRLIT